MLAAYGVSALLLRDLRPDLLLVYGFTFGAAHGLLYPTLNALVLEVLPPTRKGLGMVLYNGAFNLGSSVGSLGWGLLAARYGYASMYIAAAALAAFAILSLALGRPRSASPIQASG
jgi:predicted MFS family arabinose efflux permease